MHQVHQCVTVPFTGRKLCSGVWKHGQVSHVDTFCLWKLSCTPYIDMTQKGHNLFKCTCYRKTLLALNSSWECNHSWHVTCAPGGFSVHYPMKYKSHNQVAVRTNHPFLHAAIVTHSNLKHANTCCCFLIKVRLILQLGLIIMSSTVRFW